MGTVRLADAGSILLLVPLGWEGLNSIRTRGNKSLRLLEMFVNKHTKESETDYTKGELLLWLLLDSLTTLTCVLYPSARLPLEKVT